MNKSLNTVLVMLFIAALMGCKSTDTSAFNQRLDTLFGEHQAYAVFFDALQQAINNRDAPAVADLNQYPLRVITESGMTLIAHKDAFIARYDEIITHNMVETIKKQTFSQLFANNNGVMVGSGQIWFTGICESTTCEQQQVKVITYNSTAK